MRYLDTSLLVALLTPEQRTRDVEQWMRALEPEGFAISNWVVTEFSAALSAKLRDRKLNEVERAKSLAAFNKLAAESFARLPVEDRHFHDATRLSDREGTGLRAGDALHLAIALESGAVLCTLDKGMAKAGMELGIAIELL